MQRALRSSLLALLLASAVIAGASCRAATHSVEPSGNGTETVTATTSAEPTSSAQASDTTAPAGAQSPGQVRPLDEAQAKALESELRAIERELEGLDLPSDADFEGIEGELP